MISLRDQAGVTSTNKYLFASTQKSDGYLQGSHKINNVVHSIGGFVITPRLLTATKFRHGASILFIFIML